MRMRMSGGPDRPDESECMFIRVHIAFVCTL